jgi:group II intron reverse transcriptase/maturase
LHIGRQKTNWVVEADIRGFFDHVDHGWMLRFVAHRIGDPRMLGLIERFLKAGVMEQGRREPTEQGTPQGGVASPVLANVYLHYVLDAWFARRFASQCLGEAHLVRYCDDFVACFQHEEDARRFVEELAVRLGSFALEVEPSKTRILRFGRFARQDAERAGERLGTFEFLGLEHYCGRSRAGRFKLKWRTSGKRFRAKLRAIGDWLRRNLTLPLPALWQTVNAKLRGHFAYYGVSDNWPQLHQFRRCVYWRLSWAMNRRSQRRSFTHESWQRYVNFHGLVNPGKLVNLNPFTPREPALAGSRMR